MYMCACIVIYRKKRKMSHKLENTSNVTINLKCNLKYEMVFFATRLTIFKRLIISSVGKEMGKERYSNIQLIRA